MFWWPFRRLPPYFDRAVNPVYIALIKSMVYLGALKKLEEMNRMNVKSNNAWVDTVLENNG